MRELYELKNEELTRDLSLLRELEYDNKEFREEREKDRMEREKVYELLSVKELEEFRDLCWEMKEGLGEVQSRGEENRLAGEVLLVRNKEIKKQLQEHGKTIKGQM